MRYGSAEWALTANQSSHNSANASFHHNHTHILFPRTFYLIDHEALWNLYSSLGGCLVAFGLCSFDAASFGARRSTLQVARIVDSSRSVSPGSPFVRTRMRIDCFCMPVCLFVLASLSTSAAYSTCTRAFRELMTFWTDASMSVSMSMPLPPPPPSPVEIPGFDFSGYYSMSMSMSMPGGPGFGLGDTIYFPGDGTASGGVVTLPTQVDDAGSSSGVTTTATATDGTDTTTGGDGADTTTAENLGKGASSPSSGASTPQTVLMVVLVGAALAVMSAWYVRKNQRSASSNASQMTPTSASLL